MTDAPVVTVVTRTLDQQDTQELIEWLFEQGLISSAHHPNQYGFSWTINLRGPDIKLAALIKLKWG